jgi:hypothetical protein
MNQFQSATELSMHSDPSTSSRTFSKIENEKSEIAPFFNFLLCFPTAFAICNQKMTSPEWDRLTAITACQAQCKIFFQLASTNAG